MKNENLQSKYPLFDLKDISEIVMGNSPSSNQLTKKEVGYTFIGGAADIQDGIVISDRYINSSAKISYTGDILYLIRATIGNPIISDRSYYLGRGVSAIRAKADIILTDFLINVLKLIEESIIKLGTGSTFKQISKPILEKIKIPVPPLDVQIVMVERMQKEFSKMKELKQELVANENLGIEFFEKEIFK